MDWALDYIWLIPVLPLLGSVLTAALGPKLLRGQAHVLVVLASVGSAVVALLLLGQLRGQEADQIVKQGYDWITAGDFSVHIRLHIDRLTGLMLAFVTGVGALIVIYSRGYMKGDRGYWRFFSYLGLFLFSMTMLVLAGNFLLLYVFWEAVGLCSYLLIGFWYEKPSAAAAAKKAFLVNRVGDFGFGLGVMLIFLQFGSLDYTTVFHNFTSAPAHIQTWITALLFVGCVGKSAQFPLYVWLPDAMEGPSPVSALIHAATMVTAGVYLVARCFEMFAATPVTLAIVAVVGAFTAIFAATMALCQFDLKRVLAYSTVSQLGYMFLGLGVAAPTAAIFHVFTHAFFKALLFLAAGSVMHAMGNIIDMRQFGGLRRIMPWTFWTFLVGSLALAGVPFLSGFFSKDAILAAALNSPHHWHFWLGVVGLLAALLTAFYTFRMFFVTFHGPLKTPEHAHDHDSPAVMIVPLVLLAVGAIVAGYLPVEKFLAGEHSHAIQEHESLSHTKLMVISGAVALAGILLAAVMYLGGRQLPQKLAAASGWVYELIYNRYWVDQIYDALIVRPLRTAGQLFYNFDRYVVDWVLWLITAVPQLMGSVVRSTQQGQLQGYAVGMVAGLVLLIIMVLLATG